ncbi:MAG: tRNA pseudouridine(38-40) synthase TruA [Sandaracinaceae bacterium]|nr:tRNA pseudouridine(38-40) synthase TruA [Sandaracinaceae bacterium]
MYGVRVVVSYDGTGFCGWQRQPGLRTVQEELEAAVAKLTGEPTHVRATSRTDSGVHAFGQLAAFDTPRDIPDFGWVRGINGKLTDEIAVLSAEPCAPGYDPRYDAEAKTYRYLLHLGPIRDPLLRDRAWHLGPRRARPCGGWPTHPSQWLDVPSMQAAAAEMVGTHDFKAFKRAIDPREKTVRTLTRVDVIEHWGGREDLLAVEIRGNSFMHNMIRILVGTLLDVGRERMTPEDVRDVIVGGERKDAGETAPACGLYLVEVERRAKS